MASSVSALISGPPTDKSGLEELSPTRHRGPETGPQRQLSSPVADGDVEVVAPDVGEDDLAQFRG